MRFRTIGLAVLGIVLYIVFLFILVVLIDPYITSFNWLVVIGGFTAPAVISGLILFGISILFPSEISVENERGSWGEGGLETWKNEVDALLSPHPGLRNSLMKDGKTAILFDRLNSGSLTVNEAYVLHDDITNKLFSPENEKHELYKSLDLIAGKMKKLTCISKLIWHIWEGFICFEVYSISSDECKTLVLEHYPFLTFYKVVDNGTIEYREWFKKKYMHRYIIFFNCDINSDVKKRILEVAERIKRENEEEEDREARIKEARKAERDEYRERLWEQSDALARDSELREFQKEEDRWRKGE
jgi:hypothetical protein